MDRAKLANKFQWHIEKSAELWVVRNFYDGRIESEFKNYDEAFDRCNLLNIDLALKGLDEWESISSKHRNGRYYLVTNKHWVRSRVGVFKSGSWWVNDIPYHGDLDLCRFLPTPPKEGGVK